MARKTKKQIQKEKKIALALLSLLGLAVLSSLLFSAPWLGPLLLRYTGVLTDAGPPDVGVPTPVAAHVIDVGQGSATLLASDGHFALIDAGPPESKAFLAEYLRRAGVEKLDYLVMTHPHADHIGGMQEVLETFQVQHMILPDFSLAPYPTTPLFEGVLETLLYKNVPTEQAALGLIYPMGNASLSVVHAGLATPDNYNLLSLGILFEAPGLRVLCTGDGEAENERAMVDSGYSLQADLLIAGHHGSYTSNTLAFVEAVAPQVVAISCQKGNSYGHPHNTPLAVFEKVGAVILRTDKDKSILVWPSEGQLLHAVKASQPQ